MQSPCILLFFFITMILLVFNHLKCEARDIINEESPLSGEETLVSAGKRFELGFFTPQGNEKNNRYVGIWYHKLIPRTIVWVARRDNPVPDSCGVFGIAGNGNVTISCNNGNVFPVTDLEESTTYNRTLQLLDSGNLILYEGRENLWQSFDHPTDTFLPGMKMNDDMELTSWISPSNPGSGDYTFHSDQGVYSIQNRSTFYWKSGEVGPLGKFLYNELPDLVAQLLLGHDTQLDQKTGRSVVGNHTYISFPNKTEAFYYNNSRLLMRSSGQIQYYYDYNSSSSSWSAPQDNCSVYERCGKFAICNIENEQTCQCLRGFEPVSFGDWKDGKYSDGCERKSTCSQRDGFLNLKLMKIGGDVTSFDRAEEEATCKEECLNNCKCEAYMFRAQNESRENGYSNTKCQMWISDLVNLQIDNTGVGRLNLSLRVPFSSTASASLKKGSRGSMNKIPTIYVVFTILLFGAVVAFCCSYILHRRRQMAEGSGNRGSIETDPVLFSYESERPVSDMMPEKEKGVDVPFYDFNIILSATDNFSDANKLGRGGFGPVYKGKFPGGHEIAVKRLSSFSGQGVDEFLNEVILIAKLQHRNLVRLLGYCIKGNEKILLYEYMPNRSLDALIFDQKDDSVLLDWKKRFDIILGIARGLLYLHQDSRLRIIHRDLKTSNILLDEEMNPKISDFGLARIIEGKRTEESTNKVVGTFGYMSPEYALDGKFSIKSDVFSFGVVMLEIVSGKKNTGFYNPQEVMNLLGYAWRLWSENKAIDLLDQRMMESCEKSQVMTCINVGLLCVQEDPNDRPSMSTVILMLGSENTTLPTPAQPAFVIRRYASTTSSSSSTKPNTISNNELTFSIAEGR